MKINRFMIAAPGSGSGKTVVTCALIQIMKEKGFQVSSCKCGPDYIDPLFHEKVIGVPAKNLDTFFTSEQDTRKLFIDSVEENSMVVLEGVMGLYDGLGGIREEGSSYHLAQVTKTPIVLVVDAKGMGRSVVALIAGFINYDKENLIQGVILNRISKQYYEIVKPLIEELKIQVMGFLPEKEAYHIKSRHLGLVLPDELEDIHQNLTAAAEEVSQTVSIDNIIKLAEKAEELNLSETAASNKNSSYSEVSCEMGADRAVIAVARDEAFCFYYTDNIRLLKESGAEIKFFSPLRDEKLPDGCNALLFGGGYPELYAKELSANSKMRRAVKDSVEGGMPIVAECGGFMYLHTAITDREGISYDMADVIPAVCYYTGKLVRFGYVEIREKQNYFLPKNQGIKGHEFHYYDSSDNGGAAIAVKPVTGKEYSCIIEDENRWLGFPHLYYPSNPEFAKAFVRKAEKYKERMVNSIHG